MRSILIYPILNSSAPFVLRGLILRRLLLVGRVLLRWPGFLWAVGCRRICYGRAFLGLIFVLGAAHRRQFLLNGLAWEHLLALGSIVDKCGYNHGHLLQVL